MSINPAVCWPIPLVNIPGNLQRFISVMFEQAHPIPGANSQRHSLSRGVKRLKPFLRQKGRGVSSPGNEGWSLPEERTWCHVLPESLHLSKQSEQQTHVAWCRQRGGGEQTLSAIIFLHAARFGVMSCVQGHMSTQQRCIFWQLLTAHYNGRCVYSVCVRPLLWQDALKPPLPQW